MVARAIPEGRFNQLIGVATRIFIARGYRLTQMSDIAESLGVAKGTLYGYVESKEALFDAAVRFADGNAELPTVSDLPLRTPAPGQTVAYVRHRVAVESADLMLAQVVSGSRVFRDVGDEIEAVLSDLYRRIARNRLALKLVDSCAADYPDLARAWFLEGRSAQVQMLAELLSSRGAKKRYRRVGELEVVARTLIETVAFWALHRHFDPSPQMIDDSSAERAVIDLVAYGLVERHR
jgi:AcrR family transcriptional regulator